MPFESFSTLNPPGPPGVALPIEWLTVTTVTLTVEKKQDQFALPEPKTKRQTKSLISGNSDFNAPCRYLHGHHVRHQPMHQHRCLWVVPVPRVPRPRWMSSWRRASMPSRGGPPRRHVDKSGKQMTQMTDFWESPNFLIVRFVCFDFFVPHLSGEGC